MANGDVVGSARIRIEADGSGLPQQTQGILGQFRGLAAGIVGIFAGIQITRFIREGIREIAELDTAIREVGTLLGSEAVEMGALDDIRAGVADLALEFGTLSDVAVPAVYQAISAGVPQANVFNFLEDANRAAIAGVTDLETSVTTIAGLVNAYGEETLSAADASDILFTTIRGGITNFEQLSAGLSQVTPTAAALGVSFDQVGAALATITQQGVPTRQATTSLNQVFAELGRGSTEVAGIFRELTGQTFPDFIAQGGSLEDAMALLDQEAQGTGQSMLDLFSSVEAGRAALLLTGTGAEIFAEQLEAMEERAGATDDAFSIMADGIGFTMDRLTGAVEVARQSFFEAFGPAVVQLIEQFQPVLTELAPLLGELGANLVAAFAPLAEVFVEIISTLSGPLIQSITAIAEGVAVLAGVVGPLAAELIGGLAPGLQLVANILDALPAQVIAFGVAWLFLRNTVGLLGLLRVALTAIQTHPVIAALSALTIAFSFATQASDDFRFSAGQVQQGLLDLRSGVDTAVFDQLADAFGRMENTIEVLGIKLSTELGSGFGSGTRAANEFAEIASQVDLELANLVTGGSLEEAAASVTALGTQLGLSGSELDAFAAEHLPEYLAALDQVEAQNVLAAESVTPLVEAQQALGEQMGATGEEAQRVAQEFVDSWASAAEQFFDVSGAFAQVVEEFNAEQASMGEGANAAGEQVALSLADVITNYEGATERITEILLEQVQAQAEWQANMSFLAERVSTDVLEQLQRLGPEGAPFVADLVEQSDAELAASTMPFIAAGLSDDVSAVLASADWDDSVSSADARMLRQLQADFGRGQIDAGSFVSRVESILAGANAVLTPRVDQGALAAMEFQLEQLARDRFATINVETRVARGPGGTGGLTPFGAEGGIFDRATPIIIGEAGREVLLPLTDPRRTLQLAQDSGLTSMLVGALSGRPSANTSSGPAAAGVRRAPVDDRPVTINLNGLQDLDANADRIINRLKWGM